MKLKCQAGRFLVAGLLLAGAVQAQEIVWLSRYDRGLDDDDYAIGSAMCPDGNIAVAGHSWSSDNTWDIHTMKLSPDSGTVLWDRYYSWAPGIRDTAHALAVDDEGNVFVTGITVVAPDTTDYLTIKYDSAGSEQWVMRYHHILVDAPWAVVPDRNGGCFVTGQSWGETVDYDYATVHYGADGTELWVSRYVGPAGGDDCATAMALDADGDLYVTGYTLTGGTDGFDYFTVKYDTATGDTVWTRTYDGHGDPIYDPKDDSAFAITVDGSGNVYVTGKAGQPGTNYDATTVKYAPDGTLVWENMLNDPLLNGPEVATEIVVDENERVYCGGYTSEYMGFTSEDWLVYVINPDSTTAWFDIDTQNGAEDARDIVFGLAIDEHHNVYATGQSDHPVETEPEWRTRKYSASGVVLWDTVYGSDLEHLNEDIAFSILVDDIGDVYVTGYDGAGNWEDYDAVTIKYSEADVCAGTIVQPSDTLRLAAAIHPRAWVRNCGALEATAVQVKLEISTFYTDAQIVPVVPAYDSVLVEFATWVVRDAGTFTVRCYTQYFGDKDPANDTSYGEVTGVPAWEQLPSMPAGPKGREVKDGGSLTYVADSLVFAFKGNNTTEFYAYDLMTETWVEKESLPRQGRSGKKKRVKRGARLEYDLNEYIYALKGNNTTEFWRYHIPTNTWLQLEDYPLGGGRKPKGGTGLELVPSQGKLYSCKGSSTFEFYSYDIGANTWTQLTDVPGGPRDKKCKYGTCIAYDGDNTIYLLKGGSKYLEFYAYSISGNTWSARKSLRDGLYASRKSKPYKGAALVWDTLYERVYATKGRKLNEFWLYEPTQDSWYETQDSIPLGPERKPPYYGSTMEYGGGKVYFLRGYKTLEFWRYHANFPLNPGGFGGPQAVEPVALARLSLTAAPNPFLGQSALRYSLPRPGQVRLAVFDVTGRCQQVLVDEYQAAGNHVARLGSEGLAAGVYIAKLSVSGKDETSEVTKKLLLTR